MTIYHAFNPPEHPEDINPDWGKEPDEYKIINGTEYDLDELGYIICPMCGESNGVNEDHMYCVNCDEHI